MARVVIETVIEAICFIGAGYVLRILHEWVEFDRFIEELEESGIELEYEEDWP